MFCEECGAKNPDDATFCSGCGKRLNSIEVKKEKSMVLAMVISFVLTGLGIAYAGNVKRGILLFAVALICSILGYGLPFLKAIGVVLWAIAMYLTYVEVERANGRENPDIIKDFKGWTASKKAGAIILVVLILLIVVGGVIGALTPHNQSSTNANHYYSSTGGSSYDSGSSPGSSSGSSSSNSYSSSSNGRNVESHYEGDYGSADTHGTVYDDGSVESHQKGHTDYGDYQIDSYMDSNGNIHGTVDVGGKTYHVSY